jgi:hypothetical protein
MSAEFVPPAISPGQAEKLLDRKRSVRFFLAAEFLESRIGAQRIPDWIEPKKSRRNGR